MTATITLYHTGFYYIYCKNPAFVKYWGKRYMASSTTLFKVMTAMTEWANNEEGEEMTFEVE